MVSSLLPFSIVVGLTLQATSACPAVGARPVETSPHDGTVTD